jgi:hypothetical protein
MKSLYSLIAITVFLAAPLLPGVTARAMAQDMRSGDIILGARGGYSHLEGYWQRELVDAPCLGLFQDFLIRDRVMAEVDVFYAAYPLENTASSKIYTAGVAAGPLWHYPILPYARVYGGVSLSGTYFSFRSDEYGKRDRTFKPGGLLKAGVFIPVWQSVMLRVGADYSIAPLSGKAFGGLNFTAGVSYNYYALARAVTAEGRDGGTDRLRSGEVEAFYNEALKRFKEGDLAAAKDGFTRVDEKSAYHRDATAYLAQIAKAEASLAEGKRQFDDGRYYEAIPGLDDAAKISAEARALVKSARERLAAEVPVLEQMGVAAYERGEYEQCILIMKKLQLADPENRVMVIYLPRAQKRYEGLQKLK